MEDLARNFVKVFYPRPKLCQVPSVASIRPSSRHFAQNVGKVDVNGGDADKLSSPGPVSAHCFRQARQKASLHALQILANGRPVRSVPPGGEIWQLLAQIAALTCLLSV
jgi:hypothetical protein